MALPATAVSLLVLAALTVQTARAQAGAPPDAPPDASGAQRYESTFEQGDGTDLVLLYIGSQDCGPCHWPELKAAVEQAKVLLQARAAAEGKRFSAVGVVKNYDWKEGLAFLEETGYFDEVVAGKSWFNSAVVEHCHEREGCTPAMPQVIVYEQATWTEGGRHRFGPRTYLTTVTGADAIPRWVAAGAPLPYAPAP